MNAWVAVRSMATYRLWLFVLSGVLVALLVYGVPLAPGFIARSFLDALGDGAPFGAAVWIPLVLLAGVGFARAVLFVLAVTAERGLQLVISTLLRRNVLEHVLRQPGAQALPASSGEAIARLRNDVNAVALGLSWMLDPLGQLVFGIIAFAALVRVDPLLTLAVLTPIVVVIGLVRLSNVRIRAFRAAAQQTIGNVTGLLGEVFGAALTIKVAGAEARVIAHLRALDESRRRASVADRVFSRFVASASTNVANLGTGVLLLLAARAMTEGRFTVGEFAMFVSYIFAVTQTSSMFGEFMTNYRQLDVSLQRLHALMRDAPPGALVKHAPIYLTGPLPLPTPAESEMDLDQPLEELSAEHVSFVYPGTQRGILDVSFRVRRGEFTVITGRIGSGKTTLVRVLLGLLPMQSGVLRWNQQPIADPGSVFVPPRSAYTPQAPRLVSESLRDNILLGVPEHVVDLDTVIHAAVLERDVPELEEGLDTPVGPRGVKLSGGQVQRVAAARMFARPAELVVVDDLSSALDVETERLLWDRLLQRTDLTCIAVSHRHAALRRAHQILLMEDGRIVDRGTLPELLERSSAMRELWVDVS